MLFSKSTTARRTVFLLLSVPLAGWNSVDSKRVDSRGKLLGKTRVHKTMSLDDTFPLELITDNLHSEVLLGSFWNVVQVALAFHFEMFWLERGEQLLLEKTCYWAFAQCAHYSF